MAGLLVTGMTLPAPCHSLFARRLFVAAEAGQIHEEEEPYRQSFEASCLDFGVVGSHESA